jgi:hypothetical protein
MAWRPNSQNPCHANYAESTTRKKSVTCKPCQCCQRRRARSSNATIRHRPKSIAAQITATTKAPCGVKNGMSLYLHPLGSDGSGYASVSNRNIRRVIDGVKDSKTSPTGIAIPATTMMDDLSFILIQTQICVATGSQSGAARCT